MQHNERSRYSDQSEIRVLTMGGTLEYNILVEDENRIVYNNLIECSSYEIQSRSEVVDSGIAVRSD